ncbi:MAG: SDR family oxidoreductase [Spirochaetales bacterium]|nr:SDR family oxidoreductase [Spirochaetales bacterium]
MDARFEFKEKVAVVTGGAGGIGTATAGRLLGGGAQVILADIDEAAGSRKVQELQSEGGRVEFVRLDVSDVGAIRDRLAAVVSRHGRIDILVNAAGIDSLTSVPDITPEEWDRLLAVNLRSTFFCSQEALKSMCPRGCGKIVNLASAAGKIGGVAVGAHYSASKAAIICLTKSLALYAAPYRVNVNCVCPGPTATRMTDAWGEKINTAFADRIPFKRYGTPEEVAEAICFLASDRAGYITGETMDVNGGLVMD